MKRAISILLALFFCLSMGACSAKTISFSNQIEAKDYHQAYQTYSNLSPEEQTEANNWLSNYVTQIEDKYYDGTYDYSTATSLLDALERFTAISTNIAIVKKNIDTDNSCTISYNKAKSYASVGNWKDAYLLLKDFSSQYRQYGEVAKLRDNCKSNYKTSVIEDMERYAENRQFEGIDKVFKESAAVLPNDAQISQAYQTQLDAYIDNTLTEANQLAKNGEYEKAIEIVSEANKVYYCQKFVDAINQYSDNFAVDYCNQLAQHERYLDIMVYLKGLKTTEKVTSLKKEYHDKLVKQTLSGAYPYIQNRDFTAAINHVQEVAKSYNCEEFQLAIEDYARYLPIPLTECWMVDDSDGWSGSNIEIGDCLDNLGNKHSDALEIHPSSDSTEYVLYNTENRFVLLSGTIAYGNGSWLVKPVNVTIYVDDVLVYSCEVSKTSQPINISIDVSGATMLRIEVSREDTSYMSSAGCVIDATLS